jgi:hypothetical protein
MAVKKSARKMRRVVEWLVLVLTVNTPSFLARWFGGAFRIARMIHMRGCIEKDELVTLSNTSWDLYDTIRRDLPRKPVDARKPVEVRWRSGGAQGRMT